MEFHKYELTSKFGFWSRQEFVVTDENGAIYLVAKHPTMWKKKMNIYNADSSLICKLDRNMWVSKFELFFIEGNQSIYAATLKTNSSLKSKLSIITRDNTSIELVSDFMMKEYKFIDPKGEELGIALKQTKGFRPIFGIAVSYKIDEKIALVSLLVLLWRASMAS